MYFEYQPYLEMMPQQQQSDEDDDYMYASGNGGGWAVDNNCYVFNDQANPYPENPPVSLFGEDSHMPLDITTLDPSLQASMSYPETIDPSLINNGTDPAL